VTPSCNFDEPAVGLPVFNPKDEIERTPGSKRSFGTNIARRLFPFWVRCHENMVWPNT